MAKVTVFLLGAGAVAEAGLPLTKEFFSRGHRYDPRIYPRHYDNNDRFLRLWEIFEQWRKKRGGSNVEEFFNHVSMRSLTRQAFIRPSTGDRVDPQLVLRDLIWYLSSYIVYRRREQRNPPEEYRTFVAGISAWGSNALVTFNYDTLFERMLINFFGEFDYGFDSRTEVKSYGSMKHSSHGITYLKLHGSVN